MWRAIVLYTIVGLAVTEKVSYENYQVLGIKPTIKGIIKILQIWENPNEMFFWNEPIDNWENLLLVISPHHMSNFSMLAKSMGLPFWTCIYNIQYMIDVTSDKETEFISPGFVEFDLNRFHTLDEIYAQFTILSVLYKDKVQIVTAGKSYEERLIQGVKISFKANNPGIFIEGGMHANEWMSPATVMYILDQVLFSNDTDVRALAESHDWYIFPVFNPDGYVYSHTTDRLWKKTRKPYGRYFGADLAKNWPYGWMTEGASNNSGSSNYAGSAPLSEPEAKIMSEYIESISDKFYAYISFRGYSLYVSYPYNDTTATDFDLYDISLVAAAALRKRYGMPYTIAISNDLIYENAGSTISYISNTYHKDIILNYGFRESNYSFLQSSDQIVYTGKEIVDSLVASFQRAKEKGYPKKKKIEL